MARQKYFTVEEANALLPTLKPLMQAVLERRARVSMTAQGQRALLHDDKNNIGSSEFSEMTQDFIAIEALLEEIRSYGVIVKDLNGGLIDFLCDRNGRDVYLCWKYDEPEVEYFHELHAGFAGREPI